MLPEISVDTPPNLANLLAVRLETEAGLAIAARGRFSLALSGGSVADALFPRLARAKVDWSLIDFFFCDERAVPPDNPESNYQRARSLWIDVARVPAANVHRMKAEASNLDAAAMSYEDELIHTLGEPPGLDMALLGVGDDGHVCSLFPNHPLLGEERRWVAAITDSPKPPAARLTLTLPALGAARLIVLAAFGEAKARVIRAAIEERDASLPLTRVFARARKAIVLLDSLAAGRLSHF
jgi:6-phosphogluconolactonase